MRPPQELEVQMKADINQVLALTHCIEWIENDENDLA